VSGQSLPGEILAALSALVNYHEIVHKLINECITQAEVKSMPGMVDNRSASDALATPLFGYLTERHQVASGRTISARMT